MTDATVAVSENVFIASITDANVNHAAAMIRKVETTELLDAIRDAEKRLGGRKTIFKAIDRRRAELHPDDAVNQLVLIEILRHITGPPRRAVGQRLRLTGRQIERQRLELGRDYEVVD